MQRGPLVNAFAGLFSTQNREGASYTFKFDFANSIQMSVGLVDAIFHR